jgi:hypothetical protein
LNYLVEGLSSRKNLKCLALAMFLEFCIIIQSGCLINSTPAVVVGFFSIHMNKIPTFVCPSFQKPIKNSVGNESAAQSKKKKM